MRATNPGFSFKAFTVSPFHGEYPPFPPSPCSESQLPPSHHRDTRGAATTDCGTRSRHLHSGFGGTFASDESPAGVAEWYTNRGLAPNKLALESFGNGYQNLIQSLQNVGYITTGPSQNLFVGLWDWRVPVAPTDATAISSPDGTLSNVTASSISDNIYATGLDYFGQLLAQVKTLHPTITKVDVIAHSTGGLVARSYIQSAAYGQAGLPTIDDLVMVGVPNAGVTDVWNLSLNDWNAEGVTRVAGQMVERAYDLMRAGTPINLVGVPGGTINNPSISLDAFVQQYVGAMRHLLPTYQAVDTNADGQFETIGPSNPAGNTLFNDLLIDLNAGPKNAWLNSVGTTNIVYSTEVDTNDQIIKRTGPSSAGFLTDEILPFTNILGRRPNPGETGTRTFNQPMVGMAPCRPTRP